MFFVRHGRLVARNPVLTIACSFLATSLTFVGFINFRWETNTVKLWLPQGSEFVKVRRVLLCQDSMTLIRKSAYKVNL